MTNMKQMEVTEKTIGDATFYIKPFPAFTAANISGELAAVLTPLLSGLVSLVGNNGKDGEGVDLMNTDVETALPVVTQAFSSLSGDKFEKLMKKLIIDNNNVSVECEATDMQVKPLTYSLANEVFCGEVQDMFILCYEVIRLNFNGFFKKLGGRFGNLKSALQTVQNISDSANLTTPGSAT